MCASLAYFENLESCEPALNHQVEVKTILESCQSIYSTLDNLYIAIAQLIGPKSSSETEQNQDAAWR